MDETVLEIAMGNRIGQSQSLLNVGDHNGVCDSLERFVAFGLILLRERNLDRRGDVFDPHRVRRRKSGGCARCFRCFDNGYICRRRSKGFRAV